MNIINYFTDLLFPPRCIFCKNTLPPKTRPFVCEKCHAELKQERLVCAKCGGELSTVSGLPSCPVCRISGRYYDAAVSSLPYKDTVSDAICRYKYSYQRYIAEHITVFLEKSLKSINVNRTTIDYIISVPSSANHKSSRGFDSAALIAKSLSHKLNIPYLPEEVLRIKNTPPQSGLSFKQRQENVKGAFKLNNKEIIKHKNILLIDDVITTGATIMEISRILRRAGVKYILAASVAKTTK